MNGYSTSTDSNYSTCLPPEAYLRIIRNCGTDTAPKFKSTVYPSNSNNKKSKNAKRTATK